MSPSPPTPAPFTSAPQVSQFEGSLEHPAFFLEVPVKNAESWIHLRPGGQNPRVCIFSQSSALGAGGNPLHLAVRSRENGRKDSFIPF